MKKYLLIIGVFLWSFSTVNGQSISEISLSDQVQSLVDSLAEENILMGSSVGYFGSEPLQFSRFEQLKESASDSELASLTNHQNGVVRCYAIWGLSDSSGYPIFDIVKSHLRDNEVIQTMFGCIAGNEFVGDIFLGSIELTDAQRIEVDSIMLFDDSILLNAKRNLLKRLSPEKSYYPKIRELALNGELSAMLALAKYRKPEDIQLIENLLKDPKTEYWGFRCVQYFPSPSFFGYLKLWHSANISKKGGFYSSTMRVFYKALVQYKTAEALALLESSLKDSRGFGKKMHHEYILIALLKYPDEFFYEIRLDLKVDKYKLEELLWDKSEVEID